VRRPPTLPFALAAALGALLEAPRAHAQPAPLPAAPIAAAPVAGEPARGAPLELRVSYAAPPGCPSGAQFLDALQAHLAAGGDGAVDAVVRISGPRDGDFELSLRLSVAGSVTESHARAESCSALMELAALDASMARTPWASAGASVTPAAYVPEAPPAASPAPPGADEAPQPEEASARTPAEPRGFALAETRAARGMLPSLAWGQGLVLGAALGPWSLRLAGTWWLPEPFVYDGDGGSPISMSFEQQSLEVAPCAGHALTPLLELEGCVALSVNRTMVSAGEREIWGAVAPALLAVLRPWRGLRVEAAAQLVVPFSAPSFAVQALEDVFTASGVQPGARLAVGWELGSASPQPPAAPPAFDPLRGARAGRTP
jgi:hypothetical protein